MRIIFIGLLSSIFLYSSHKITNIPEASGISYCKDSNTLMVANDEGTLYEITPTGKIILKHKLGDYDLEGVVCLKKEVIVAVESGSLLRVNRKSLEMKKVKIKGRAFKFRKKSGIEGIAKIGKLYYLTIQAKKKKKRANILVIKLNSNSANIMKIINHKIIDSAGMEYHNDKLYIVSDTKDKLYIYDYKKNRVLKKIKLDKFAQEGITFDRDNNIYFADDNGAVFKYSKRELKIK